MFYIQVVTSDEFKWHVKVQEAPIAIFYVDLYTFPGLFILWA
jgi:hypothetical protein